MSRLRHNSPGVSARLRAIEAARRAGTPVGNPFGRDCVDTTLGQRLGIAAIYGGQGDADTARAAALLACAEITDTPDNRAAVLSAIDDIRNTVREAVGLSGGLH